jgi:hypothetical protein
MMTDLAGTRDENAALPTCKRHNLYDVIFSPLTATFAVAALVLSFLLPPEGSGIPMCWFKWAYGHPCPGCGLSRSLTCISHLQFEKAWAYHPFGLLIYVLFFANALLLLMPSRKRAALRTRMSAQDRWLKPIYWSIVISFLIFGFVRLLWSVLAG